MSVINQRYLRIAEAIAERTSLPLIKEIYVPNLVEESDCKHKFGVVILADGSAGIMYILMDKTLPQLHQYVKSQRFQGLNPLILARSFVGTDPVQKTLALGTLNAIGQFAFRNSDYMLDYTTDSLALFHPRSGDTMGMVGYFPPLVERIREAGVALTVIELKDELVRKEPGFQVTLDVRELRHCTKVLCTSTVILNDSLEDVLQECRQAERVAVIGPSAGFLPDPLFGLGVDTIGGTHIYDAELFLDICRKGGEWRSAARKYCIQREHYPGYEALLTNLRTT